MRRAEHAVVGKVLLHLWHRHVADARGVHEGTEAGTCRQREGGLKVMFSGMDLRMQRNERAVS